MESTISYDQAVELDRLQAELVRMQMWVKETGARVVVLFEGRDTAGKGGAIYRFMRYLDPRSVQVVALPKPGDRERGQWYFQRYIPSLPTLGEIVFYDRSWYNRAVVEPALKYCSPEAYELFLSQVPIFEQMLVDDGIHLIKLWFSIDRATQQHRLEERARDVRRQWKLSATDFVAFEQFEEFSRYKEVMYERTHRESSPWVIVQGQDKYLARTEAMRYLLHRMGWQPEDDLRVVPDPEIVRLWQP